MDNKGFTLIELIVTIALLSIIALISFVSVNAIVRNNKIEQCNNLVSSIETATKEYVSDNRYNGNFSSLEVNIGCDLLINNNYLSSPIVNPITNNEINPESITINVTLNSDYTVKSINQIIGIDCE